MISFSEKDWNLYYKAYFEYLPHFLRIPLQCWKVFELFYPTQKLDFLIENILIYGFLTGP